MIRRWSIRLGLLIVIAVAAWFLLRLLQVRPLPNVAELTIVAVVIGAAAALLVGTFLPRHK